MSLTFNIDSNEEPMASYWASPSINFESNWDCIITSLALHLLPFTQCIFRFHLSKLSSGSSDSQLRTFWGWTSWWICEMKLFSYLCLDQELWIHSGDHPCQESPWNLFQSLLLLCTLESISLVSWNGTWIFGLYILGSKRNT